LARENAIAKLSAWFGVMALVVASIELYGIMSYSVSRRRFDIGIRIALPLRRLLVEWYPVAPTSWSRSDLPSTSWSGKLSGFLAT
jgi:hypothetical protein